MRIPFSSALRLLLSIAATGAVVLLLAACGSSGSESTSTSASGGSSASSSSSGDEDAGRVKLTRCLRDNGIDVPDSGGGMPSTTIDQEKLQEALQGPCKDLASAAGGALAGENRDEFQDAFAKFSQCMRDRGIDVPDPTAGGGGTPTQIDQDDPKVEAAVKACQDKLPAGTGLPSGGDQ